MAVAAVKKIKTTASGLTYIRWGHDACPGIYGTQLLFSGIMGGNYYSVRGGGSNFQCMPKKPEYVLKYRNGVQGYGYMFGVDYQHSMVGKSYHNVPCAVCYASTRNAIFMNPGAASCPSGWTREYYGYLMTERYHNHHQRATFECVDMEQKSVPGSKGCRGGAFLNYVEAHCSGTPCPPYDPQKELNCVVCTR